VTVPKLTVLAVFVLELVTVIRVFCYYHYN